MKARSQILLPIPLEEKSEPDPSVKKATMPFLQITLWYSWRNISIPYSVVTFFMKTFPSVKIILFQATFVQIKVPIKIGGIKFNSAISSSGRLERRHALV